jgi:hypothetical protein
MARLARGDRAARRAYQQIEKVPDFETMAAILASVGQFRDNQTNATGESVCVL